MNAHNRKTRDAILGHPAPRDIEWTQFINMWEDVADEVEQEHGDRLSVSLNGHREVFHRPHDGRVSIEDIELARHLLARWSPSRAAITTTIRRCSTTIRPATTSTSPTTITAITTVVVDITTGATTTCESTDKHDAREARAMSKVLDNVRSLRTGGTRHRCAGV